MFGSNSGTVCFDILDVPRSGTLIGTLHIEITTNAALLQRAQNDINAVYVDAFPSPPTKLIIETAIDLRPSSSASVSSDCMLNLIALKLISINIKHTSDTLKHASACTDNTHTCTLQHIVEMHKK